MSNIFSVLKSNTYIYCIYSFRDSRYVKNFYHFVKSLQQNQQNSYEQSFGFYVGT